MATTLLIIYWVSLIALMLAFQLRNESVHKERVRVAELIYELGTADIRAGRPWYWRWEEYRKVTYAEMLFRFWIPVRSFYGGRAEVQP
jgi:hypothetical protein